MTPREIFRRYANERKMVSLPGYRLDRVTGLTRHTPITEGLEGIVMFSELSASSIEDAISAQIHHFANIGRSFEWKVHAFDTPTDLADRLESEGFKRGDREGFMVYEVDRHSSRQRESEVRVERVDTPAGIHHVACVQEAVWGKPFPWLESSLCALLPQSAVFCAYVGSTPVGTAWIEFPKGAAFAELHGGAVLPSERGRGVYSALFDIRVEEAKRRGVEFLAVDAAPMSRPILLRKAFVHVCDTTPFQKEL